MSKSYVNPTFLEDALQLSISSFKRQLSAEGCINTGSIQWSNGSSINYLVNMIENTPYIQLDYNIGEKPIKYKVNLTSIPSNLGRGKLWYFLCPHTGKRCQKLHCINGYFLHRSAFTNTMYRIQGSSKKWRELQKGFKLSDKATAAYNETRKKYFKNHYKDKITKRGLRLIKTIEKSNDSDLLDVIRRL